MFAALSLPSPLHPAVVHFPIVLILLGTVVAVAAVFLPRWHLPVISAALLVLGAAGAVLAVQTGGRDGETAGEIAAAAALIDRHETWAERTEMAALVAAGLAVAAVAATRRRAVARALGGAAAVAALAATVCITETGHYGGQLVYRHGAGVNLATAIAPPAADGPAAEAGEQKGDRDQD